METGAGRGIVREIRALYALGTMAGRTDAELLERFLARGGGDAEDAFAALVARHGPMVLGVCRRMLPASHDAEDAFQATFLVLARRAGTIVRRDRVASWLYGVAVRTARAARRRSARARAAERRLMDASRVESGPPDEDREDLLSILDEELERLPRRYRAAMVACELEGKSRREAARELGIPEGTLSARLARGRKMLRDRMLRRGATLGLGPIAGQLGPLGESVVPERLIGPVVRAALGDAAGAAAVATAVSSLAESVVRMMLLARLALVAAALLTTAAGAATAVALGVPATAGGPPASGRPPAGPQADGGRAGTVGASAAAGRDRYGDPLPDRVVSRLGSTRFRVGDQDAKALRFSADGRSLLTVGEDFIVRRWETATGRLLGEVRPGPRPLYAHAAAISPDGRLIAVDGNHQFGGDVPGSERIRLLVDASSGEEVRRLPVAGRASDHALDFTPDGKFLVSLGYEGDLRVEEVAGVELLRRKVPRDHGSLVLSPDGRVVAVSSGPNSNKVLLWEWQGGGEPREAESPGERIGLLAFHPDGKALAGAGELEPFICEWDAASGRLRGRFDLPDDASPAGLAFSPDGTWLAVGDRGNRGPRHWSGRVLLAERGTGTIARELAMPGASTRQVTFAPDGRWLAAAGGVGVHVWDPRSGREVAASAAGHQGRITQIAAASGGLVVTASDDHTVRVWDAATGAERRRLEHGHWVRALALSPDGRLAVTSSLDDTVRLWDLEAGREIYKLPGHGRYGGYRAVGFAPDGRCFFSWGDDFRVRTWDVGTGKVLAEHVVQPPGVAVPDEDAIAGGPDRHVRYGPAAFAPDGRRFVVVIGASWHVVETATGRVERSVGHQGRPDIAIAVSPDGRSFASSGWGPYVRRQLPDGQVQHATTDHHPVRLVELETGRLVREWDMPTMHAGPVAFSPDGKLLAIGFGQGRGEVRIVDPETQATVATLADLESGPHTMAFSADGRYLVTGLNDDSALVWDLPRVLAGKGR